jgi:DNA-binding transcriptional LysR family regulator
LTTGATYRWKFQKAGEKIIPPVSGTFITNDPDLVVRAALDGIGVAYIVEAFVQPLISAGRIVPVLEDWAPSFSGYHIFYANRRQVPAALRVFIDFLRLSAPVNGRVPEGSRIIPSLSDPAH